MAQSASLLHLHCFRPLQRLLPARTQARRSLQPARWWRHGRIIACITRPQGPPFNSLDALKSTEASPSALPVLATSPWHSRCLQQALSIPGACNKPSAFPVLAASPQHCRCLQEALSTPGACNKPSALPVLATSPQHSRCLQQALSIPGACNKSSVGPHGQVAQVGAPTRAHSCYRCCRCRHVCRPTTPGASPLVAFSSNTLSPCPARRAKGMHHHTLPPQLLLLLLLLLLVCAQACRRSSTWWASDQL